MSEMLIQLSHFSINVCKSHYKVYPEVTINQANASYPHFHII